MHDDSTATGGEIAPPSSPADVDRVLLNAYEYLIAIGERWLAEHPDDVTGTAGEGHPVEPPAQKATQRKRRPKPSSIAAWEAHWQAEQTGASDNAEAES